MGLPGIEPGSLPCEGSVLPLDYRPSPGAGLSKELKALIFEPARPRGTPALKAGPLAAQAPRHKISFLFRIKKMLPLA